MSVPLKLNEETYSKLIHYIIILQTIVLQVGTYYNIIIIVKTQLADISHGCNNKLNE